MAEAIALEEMGEEELLAHADATAETARRAEVELLRVAYQWAIVNNPDRLDPAEAGKPGRERARRLGGEGVPHVTEFAAAQLGARIGRSPYAAAALIADALDLHHRLPALWGRVEALEVRASYARHVAARTRELSESEAGYVDAGVAESADGRLPWTRFEALVAAKVVAAAPAPARAREEKAAKAVFAKMLRTEAHGMGSFLIRADLATIDQIDTAVTIRAEALVASMPEATEDQRRVRAMLLCCHPGADDETDLADLMPDVTLFVHTYTGTTGSTGQETEHDPETGAQDRTVRVEGHHPVTAAWVAATLGPTCRFKIQPVIDLAHQAPVDGYEIPDRHRQAVRLMTPADTFPYASSLSPRMQIDHTIPFDRGGESGIGNYGPMTTRHHRIKTHGGWQVKQPFPGIYLWRDPHGAMYLVDHTGTRRLRPADEPKTTQTRLTLEIHHGGVPLDLDYDAA